jgi:hypothetical protein
MLGPDGQPLYQRVTGVWEFKTPLILPGWPAVAQGRVFGLNPEARYALQPGPDQPAKIQVTGLSENAKIVRCESTPERTVLALVPVDPRGPHRSRIALVARARFTEALLNDRPISPPRPRADYEIELPAWLVFFEGPARPGKTGQTLGDGREQGRYISVMTGLERGGRYTVIHHGELPIPGLKRAPISFYLNGGSECEMTLDYVARVPPQTALEVYVRNRQNRYGNGAIARLSLNGRAVHEFDFAPQPGAFDTDVHRWHVPLGRLSEHLVAVTIASDAKNENNADELWWTAPTLVADPEQKEEFVRVMEKGAVPEVMPVRSTKRP